MSRRVLVLGCGDVGSAVAHRLFLQGCDVVLADAPAPAHPRRGMAFTDAWFDGTATLDGVAAQGLVPAEALAAQLQTLDAVIATTAAPEAVAAVLSPDALVDARMRKRAAPPDLRGLAPEFIGLGPGFEAGRNCTLAIETAWGEALGRVVREGPTLALGGEPRVIGGAGRERFVYAATGGVWRTAARIGDAVRAGVVVGTLDGTPVRAPLAGCLRGLAHDGVVLSGGQKFLEVDPGRPPQAQGLGIRPALIARGVAAALGLPTGLHAAFFGFEAEFAATLDCIPMSMRRKLDRCGIKLALAQWRMLPRPLREALLEAELHSARHAERMAQVLARCGRRLGWPELLRVPSGPAWCETAGAVPAAVRARARDEAGLDLTEAHWAALTPLQRFALTKLAGRTDRRKWRRALAEFGLAGPGTVEDRF